MSLTMSSTRDELRIDLLSKLVVLVLYSRVTSTESYNQPSIELFFQLQE